MALGKLWSTKICAPMSAIDARYSEKMVETDLCLPMSGVLIADTLGCTEGHFMVMRTRCRTVKVADRSSIRALTVWTALGSGAGAMYVKSGGGAESAGSAGSTTSFVTQTLRRL